MYDHRFSLKKTAFILMLITCLAPGFAAAQQPKSTFNTYLLRAVEEIKSNWGLRGYDKGGVFTHNLPFGKDSLKARKPAMTMCVAAQLEIIVTALNLYAKDTKDVSVYSYLQVKHWSSTRTGTLRDLVWVNSGSYGTAYALSAYGMGGMCRFSELLPGSFVNINRNNGSGHAVLFIAFIDAAGNELSQYSDKVKGFKYFSSQGKGPGVGGFAYRYAFFGNLCPTLPKDKKRDCGIILSANQKMLNCGFMLAPGQWNAKQRDVKLAEINKIHSLGENKMNPKYADQNTTDD